MTGLDDPRSEERRRCEYPECGDRAVVRIVLLRSPGEAYMLSCLIHAGELAARLDRGMP